MKRYEGLFILNTAGKDEGVKEIIEKVSAEIAGLGGKIETVQKMDKKSFTRIADKRYTAGFYVNIIFSAGPEVIAQLQPRLVLNPDVFRVMFTYAAEPKPEAAVAA